MGCTDNHGICYLRKRWLKILGRVLSREPHCPRDGLLSNNPCLASQSPGLISSRKPKLGPSHPQLLCSTHRRVVYCCSCCHFRTQPWQWNRRTSLSKSPERWESSVSRWSPWWKPGVTEQNGQKSSAYISRSNVSGPDCRQRVLELSRTIQKAMPRVAGAHTGPRAST